MGNENNTARFIPVFQYTIQLAASVAMILQLFQRLASKNTDKSKRKRDQRLAGENTDKMQREREIERQTDRQHCIRYATMM